MENKQVRTKFFVKYSYQLGIIFSLFLLILLVLFIVGINLYFFGWFAAKSYIPTLDISAWNSAIVKFVSAFKKHLILLGIVNLAVIFLIGILFSHKFAGPVYKLEKILSDMAKGKNLDKKIFFRKDDNLDDLAAALNLTREYFYNILSISKSIVNYAESDNFKGVKEKAKELKALIANFKENDETTNDVDAETEIKADKIEENQTKKS